MPTNTTLRPSHREIRRIAFPAPVSKPPPLWQRLIRLFR